MITYWKNHFYCPHKIFMEQPLTTGFWKESHDGRSFHSLATHDVAEYLLTHPIAKDPRALDMMNKLSRELQDWLRWVEEITEARNHPLEPAWCSYSARDYQQEAIGVMSRVNRVYLNGACGTGKTFMSLMSIEAIRRAGLPAKTLILCPKALILGAWAEDIEKFTSMTWQNLRVERDPVPGRDLYLLNYDYLSRQEFLEKLLKERFDILVLDEATKAKSHEGKRAANICELADSIPRKWLLSGTPIPNGIQDAWMQFRILDGTGATLSRDFFDFRRKTHIEIKPDEGQPFWKPTPAGIRKVKARIQPLMLTYLKEVVLDLPEKVRKNIRVELTKEQTKIYNALVDEFIAWVDEASAEGRITARNILTQLNKLHQLCGGGVIDDDHNVRYLDDNPKMETLDEILEEIGDEQCIIWANFQHEVEAVAAHLNCPYIHGKVSDTRRQKIIKAFKAKELKHFVAHPGTIGHGMTLVTSHYMIYYSRDFSYEYSAQTEDRIHRIGQTEKCIYFYLIAEGTVDQKIADALDGKADIQDYLTNPRRLFTSLGVRNGRK